MTPSVEMAELRAEARYRREQRDLYRARIYGPRPTSRARMNELERRLESAELRLAQAEPSPSA